MPKVELIVSATAVEGKAPELKKELQAMLSPSNTEEGCEFYRLYESETPGRFFLHELWTTEDALEDHRKAPHFLHLRKRLDALLEKPLDVHTVKEVV